MARSRLVGGGWYEPVLAALPERDRVGQLDRMADELERKFGVRPRGAWLAERVWEPDLPTSLITAGYSWTVLDDAHFRAAAIPEEALWGPYTTDDQGKILTVFGTEQGLRYRIPFSEVDDVIGYLRDHATEAGDRLGTMGDDGEKFGGWPKTFEHCWGKTRWVEDFFAALESNSDWLTTVTPSGWLDGHGAGRARLPADRLLRGDGRVGPAGRRGHRLRPRRPRCQEAERPEARWLRGAIWRNFQIKYREINDLHKQMLRVSDLVEAMPRRQRPRRRARPPLCRSVERLLLARPVRRDLPRRTSGVSTLHRLIAAEDLAPGGSARLSNPACSSTSTSTGVRSRCSSTTARSSRSSSTRARGSAAGTCAPPGTRWWP